nr:MAG: hypothetical protein [Bacteriophage sp.]
MKALHNKEKIMKKAIVLGNTGVILVIISLIGLMGTTGSTQNIYLFTLAVSAVLVIISNMILTNIHKNIKL